MKDGNGNSSGRAERALAFLEAEKTLCARMISLIEAEQTALTVMDMKKIVALSMEKDDLAGQILQHDRMFRKEAAGIIGCGPDEATLEELLSSLDPQDRAPLAACGRELAGQRERIAMTNEVNREFIRATLGYLGDAISILTGGTEPEAMYGRGGNGSGRGRPPEMVSREI